MNEIIYVLINEAMPGYVKIGRTTNLEQRIRQMDTTNAPLPFECFYACTVNNAAFVERKLHDAFLDHRVRSNREFFEVAPDRVVSALQLAEIKNVTPNRDFVETLEDQKALDHARARRAIFNFKMADIPIGAELSFTNDESIKATVLDNKRIQLNGEITSLSASAQKLLGRACSVQGTLHWKYDGETLDERRKRLELVE